MLSLSKGCPDNIYIFHSVHSVCIVSIVSSTDLTYQRETILDSSFTFTGLDNRP